MIRIDSLWLAVGPMDMRAGAERLLARVVQVFGAAQAITATCFPTRGPRASSCWCMTDSGFGAHHAGSMRAASSGPEMRLMVLRQWL